MSGGQESEHLFFYRLLEVKSEFLGNLNLGGTSFYIRNDKLYFVAQLCFFFAFHTITIILFFFYMFVCVRPIVNGVVYPVLVKV